MPKLDSFDARYELRDGVARVTIEGDLDEHGLDVLERELNRALADKATRVMLLAGGLNSLTSAGMRLLMFTRSKMSISDTSDFLVVGASPAVRAVLASADQLGAEGDFKCVDVEPAAG
jgi:anti-anti-sigma factor